ncbi:MAG: hypothetical protein JWP36_398 [Paucimonas sp.]|nr:hypothetical protein [Paucimonas sp.]
MKAIQSGFTPARGAFAMLVAAAVLALASCGGSEDVSLLTTAGAGNGTGGLFGAPGRGPSPVALGGAGSFVILAESGISNVPTSAITGNIGLSPATGTKITGVGCPEVTGTIFTADAAGPACRTEDAERLRIAVLNKGTAYTDAAGRAADYTELGAGNIGGRNLGPATYKWSSAVLVPTNLTLTGGPNDVWIFQIAQGLIVAPGVQIILAGGALPQNVFWQTFSASMDTTSSFNGTVISQTSIAMKSGASVQGRLLAGTAVTLIQNVVKAP